LGRDAVFEEATTDSKRFRLPESLLLLFARCLLVAGLVFALARPLIYWGDSEQVADRELILIVDDSLSTARQIEGRPVYDQIRNAAKEIIAGSPEDLPFHAMLASGGGRWIGSQPQAASSTGGKSALAELAGTRPTMGLASLVGCIQKAITAGNDRETTTRPRPAQRIVVVTDGTSPAWPTSATRSLQRLRSMIEESQLPVQIQVLDRNANQRVQESFCGRVEFREQSRWS
jgi:hypothetical protein